MNKMAYYMLLFLLAACSLEPDFVMPDTNVPDAYKASMSEEDIKKAKGKWMDAEELASSDRGAWWKIFHDKTLNDLEEQAAKHNQFLKGALARVDQARALAASNVPSFLPDVEIGGNAVRQQLSSASNIARSFKPYTLFSAEGVLSYEIDLFGRVRNNYKAYLQDAQALEAAFRSTLLMLQADVAQHYFAIRALDEQRLLLHGSQAVATEAVRIIQHRYTVGEVSAIEQAQALSELASIKATLVALDSERSKLENALAVLVGQMPSEFTLDERPLNGFPPPVPAQMPSELLQRRPDISEAIAKMRAANARIGVARSALFPSLSLTTTGGFQSSELSDLFDWSGRVWSVGQRAGSALALSVFDSGRNMAAIREADAVYEVAVSDYRQQVLLAFRDVEDNLTMQSGLSKQLQYQQTATDLAVKRTKQVKERYQLGDIDYLELVEAYRISVAAQRAMAKVRGERFQAQVALIRALGGGWKADKTQASTANPMRGIELDLHYALEGVVSPSLQLH